MTDMATIIANNIQKIIQDTDMQQSELAEKLHTTKQVVSKMLTGAYSFNTTELINIAKVLHVTLDALIKPPDKEIETNTINVFMKKVNTEEARSGLKTLDRVADMILFYTEACENGDSAMKS